VLLTIDAGNTNVTLAVFDGDKTALESRVDTDPKRMSDQYAALFSDIMNLYGFDKSKVDGAVISSVVPPVTKQLILAVNRLFGVDPLTVSQSSGIKTGLSIKIDEPNSLGADLICGAVAAKTLYPCPCIAIDMGTVTKVLAIDKEGALLGGVFAPGVGIGFEAMAGKTALLPLVGADKAEKVIGRNTSDAIGAGVIIGTASMLDGLITRFEKEICRETGERCTVIATGGFAEMIIPHCEKTVILNKTLVSEGLRIIYDLNKGDI